jgi:hypothetical protein
MVKISDNPRRSRQAHPVSRRTLLMLAVTGLLAGAGLTAPTLSWAGSYPMYQCSYTTPAVAQGWSVHGVNTLASTTLSNACASGGGLGDYVFSNGQPGAVTENGDSGSQTTLGLNVPASAPNVTIIGIAAQVIGSPVTGDDAYLGFSSSGQTLPGLAKLPYGGASDYTADESWTLPQGARDFEVFVNCTTDNSSPTCNFAHNTSVPALDKIAITLAEDVPPTVSGVSGTLANAAATGAAVSGMQTLAFDAADSDSGVRSATLTLTPSGGEAPFTRTIDYAADCNYDSWNACPPSQDGSVFSIDTSKLAAGSYAAQLAVSDAAGNVATKPLGTITRSEPSGPSGVELGKKSNWDVSLTLSPGRVHLHTLIRLAGRVSTVPRPPKGKLIYLQARTMRMVWRVRRGHRVHVSVGSTWFTFQELRAKLRGTFMATYRFRLGGRHRYQIRAVAPAEGGYLDYTGFSPAITVTES